MLSTMEESLRRVHYLFRQWLTYLDFDEIVELYDNMNGDYDNLSPRIKIFLLHFIEDIMDGIDPLIEQSLINSERYCSLPSEIKILFDYDVNSVLKVNKVIEDAFSCRNTMKSLTDHIKQINYIDQKCVKCELLQIIRNHRDIIYNQS